MDIYRGTAAAALAVLTLALTATPAAADSVHPGTFRGEGFDACTAPSSATMRAWDSSPYRALGIYFGGSNRACAQPQLTAAWVAEQTAAGWHLIPIYLDKQASCTLSTKPNRIDNTQAAAQGRAAADDAVVQARAIGLAPDSTLVYDMEAYRTDDAACRTGVLTFLGAWTARLHDHGYLSGFYSSMGSGVADVVNNYNAPGYSRPDYVDFARWDNVSTVNDPAIPASFWSPQRRIKQYRGDHIETWGGVSINIDNDYLDVAPLPATPNGDFNRNGWSDLMTRGGSALALHPGNGQTLGPPVTFGSGWASMNAIIRIGDWNKDGFEDVVTRQASTGDLYFYPGTGTGLGNERVRVGSGWNSMRELTAIGDFNSDGNPDLMAARVSDGALFVYPGRSGIFFGTRVQVSSGWGALDELAGVGDFDRDGIPDLVARLTSTGALYFYAGRPNGLAVRRLISTGWGTHRDLVGAGDVNRDGFNDLIGIGANGTAYRWEGDGRGLPRRLIMGTGFGSRAPAF